MFQSDVGGFGGRVVRAVVRAVYVVTSGDLPEQHHELPAWRENPSDNDPPVSPRRAITPDQPRAYVH